MNDYLLRSIAALDDELRRLDPSRPHHYQHRYTEIVKKIAELTSKIT